MQCKNLLFLPMIYNYFYYEKRRYAAGKRGGALDDFLSILNGEKHVGRSWHNQCLDWISNFVEIVVTHSFSQSTSIGGILGPIVLV